MENVCLSVHVLLFSSNEQTPMTYLDIQKDTPWNEKMRQLFDVQVTTTNEATISPNAGMTSGFLKTTGQHVL